MNSATQQPASAGARFRGAMAEGQPLQVVGAITAYAAKMTEAVGFKAVYLSGGGAAANSLGIPDLGIETMQSRADLYRYLGYHAYEDELDALFAAKK